MKAQSLFLVAVMLFAYPVLMSAQKAIDTDSLVQSGARNYDSQKGEFHIAIQNFSFGEIYGGKFSGSVSTRVGCMISNNDMLFINGQFAWNPRYALDRNIEVSLNYRRYFGHSAFKPFVQSGIGLGHARFSDEYYINNYKKLYGTFNVGTGVSFRYKRWGFEVGIQTEYDHNFTGRVYLKPLFGISFSF